MTTNETSKPGYRKMDPAAFAALGAQQIAYLRPVVVNGQAAVAIFAADGTQIGAAPDVATAAAAVVQHEMAPALVH
ncbi:MAG: hypothetical protein ACK4PG_06195 [Acetobacteraceae bacterium]